MDSPNAHKALTEAFEKLLTTQELDNLFNASTPEASSSAVVGEPVLRAEILIFPSENRTLTLAIPGV